MSPLLQQIIALLTGGGTGNGNILTLGIVAVLVFINYKNGNLAKLIPLLLSLLNPTPAAAVVNNPNPPLTFNDGPHNPTDGTHFAEPDDRVLAVQSIDFLIDYAQRIGSTKLADAAKACGPYIFDTPLPSPKTVNA